MNELKEHAVIPEDEASKMDVGFLQHIRARVVVDSVLRGQALKRSKRLCDGGAMMSTVGPGQLRTHFIDQRGVKRARSKKEATLVEMLRSDVDEYQACNVQSLLLAGCILLIVYMAVWQALEDAFLEGFLPKMAEKTRVRSLFVCLSHSS